MVGSQPAVFPVTWLHSNCHLYDCWPLASRDESPFTPSVVATWEILPSRSVLLSVIRLAFWSFIGVVLTLLVTRPWPTLIKSGYILLGLFNHSLETGWRGVREPESLRAARASALIPAFKNDRYVTLAINKHKISQMFHGLGHSLAYAGVEVHKKL